MLSIRSRFVAACCAVLCCVAVSSLVYAQSSAPVSPQAAAEQIRQNLFDAQSSLIDTQSTADAEKSVQQALDVYKSTLQKTFSQSLPDLDTSLSATFQKALASARADDPLALAAERGQIWTGMVDGGALMVFKALGDNNGTLAHQWLLLRDFRASTKFSRPNADATLAIQGVLNGKTSAADALQSAKDDLLDTYQAQLTRSLSDADHASDQDFGMRRAEEIGLAQGYFEILAPAYNDQKGADALTTARAAFQAATAAAEANDDTAYQTARQQVDAALKSFRAAPLSPAEQARRGGQFLRFVALVPVEYARGVQSGQVVNDLEVQEALTFHQGATSAFADLETALEARNPALTGDVEKLLGTALTQINATADPAALQSTIDQINSKAGQLFPSEWQSLNSDSDVDVINSILDQVQAAVSQGQYQQAESARLEAYATLESGIEQQLRGFAPDKAVALESLFWAGTTAQPGLATLLATEGKADDVKARISDLKAALADAQTFLNDSNHAAPGVVIGNAGIIVFREGLEAVLILASLLASLRTAEERQFRRPILWGAAIAFVAAAVTWWFANQLLLSMMQLGERLEAIVSLIAIGVLLLITNWFFHRVYWTDWLAGFHSRKRNLVNGVAAISFGQLLGLVMLGFTSIYREGFETVLFLQSLVLQAGIATVLQGVALGLVGTAIVGFIAFKLQVRLPYKRMLVLTGILIGVVLLMMVGNTVHAMQEVGWMPIKPIAGVEFPFWVGQWFGTFATWQGVGLQIAAGAFVIGSYFLANATTRQNPARRHSGAAAVPASDTARQ